MNLTDVARGHSASAVNTIRAWLSVLEATYQVIVLRPYFANVGKRLVKTPKVYFTDVGTLCHLAGLRDPAHAASGPLGGGHHGDGGALRDREDGKPTGGLAPQVFFWRTLAGTEVDIVVESDRRLVPHRSQAVRDARGRA